jgi:hypothetical protein
VCHSVTRSNECWLLARFSPKKHCWLECSADHSMNIEQERYSPSAGRTHSNIHRKGSCTTSVGVLRLCA